MQVTSLSFPVVYLFVFLGASISMYDNISGILSTGYMEIQCIFLQVIRKCTNPGEAGYKISLFEVQY